MNRKYIALFVAAFVLGGGLYAVRIHAQAADVPACMKAAITARDSSIKTYFDTYGSAYLAAWNTYTGKTVDAKEKYYTALTTAERTMNTAYAVAWKNEGTNNSYVGRRSTALTTRQAALLAAWDITDATARKTAIQTAWTNYQNAVGAKTYGDSKGALMILREARAAAKAAYLTTTAAAKKTYTTETTAAKLAYNASISGVGGAKTTFEKNRVATWKAFRTAKAACTTVEDEPKGASSFDKI